MAHILSYGSLNLDLVYQVPHFVQAGETLSSTSRTAHCGGKGLNQSIAAAKAEPAVAEAIAGKTIAKEIYVKGKLVNIAVKG